MAICRTPILKLYVDSTGVVAAILQFTPEDVAILGLPDPFINDATVTLNIYEPDGVTKILDGLNIPYIALSDGTYREEIPATTGFVLKTKYKTELVAVLTGGEKQTFVNFIKAEYNPGNQC